MLYILMLFATLTFGPVLGAQAFSLNCGSAKGFQSHGRSLDVRTQGRWEALGFGHARLNYELSYGIDCTGAGSCWAAARTSGGGVIANPDYKPQRYQNYQQFALDTMDHVQQSFLLLPESVPPKAGSFPAYLMLTSVHGTYGATVPLQCQGEPVKTLSSSTSENALSEIARADRIIQVDYNFPHIRLQADAAALQKQIEAGPDDQVSVSQATQLALAVILDDFEPIEAPLNIAADGWASTHEQRLTGHLTREQKHDIRLYLREQMQSEKTTLSLYLGSTVQGQIYPPEQGENTQDNWIFVLRVPTLSDHLYWVIVDRKGKAAPYLYGFN
ncbi:MAG TPA: hypothetical protein VE954_06295 [Oligoflexus sp.]|uniref:hypothetical protein n=1 Tax=Oligoflexus sp. TaxID=1971216 RepID=UPI002D70CAFA|nr:hypothetical protein [Oligoflexus sp.]HYX32705.1 hypothetical protein [Oligoflexus sp.]